MRSARAVGVMSLDLATRGVSLSLSGAIFVVFGESGVGGDVGLGCCAVGVFGEEGESDGVGPIGGDIELMFAVVEEFGVLLAVSDGDGKAVEFL